jgi:hypothetical protein
MDAYWIGASQMQATFDIGQASFKVSHFHIESARDIPHLSGKGALSPP